MMVGRRAVHGWAAAGCGWAAGHRLLQYVASEAAGVRNPPIDTVYTLAEAFQPTCVDSYVNLAAGDRRAAEAAGR